MRRLSSLWLLAICMGCSEPRKADPLGGNYVGWMFIDGKALPEDGSQGMSQRLTLKPDGTYLFQVESSVMMKLSSKGEGTYTRVGDELTLSGSATSTMDDGYKRETTQLPQSLKLKLEDGTLVMKDGKGNPVYFRKENSGEPSLPSQLQLKHSDPAAIALLDKVKKTYASLRSFQATGVLKSHGAGFMAEEVRFKFFFQRPSKFRFLGSIIDGGTESSRTEITWDGGAKSRWYSSEFGETTDRSLGNALSIEGVTFGPEAEIVTSLLLPKEVKGSGLSTAYPEATLLPTERLGGKVFAVLQLRNKGASATKLWVDESDGMIVRLYEELRAITVTFDPHPNASIRANELLPSKHSSG